MIGWDEILSEELPETVLIQSWRGKDGLLSAVRSGRESILSNGWYIDLCQTAEFHYLNDPVTAEMGLTEEESRLVLGGEATMWAELVDDQNIDTRIWPRTAAIAERLWSHASVNDVANMYQRLDAISWLLDRAGLRHVSAQYDLMRLMSESDDVRALKKRVDVIAPVKGYERHRLAVHTTLTPLTNLADIAVPDPAYVRHVNDLISEHFATRNKLTESQLLGELRMLSRHLKSDKNTRHLPEIPYIFELLDFAIDAVYVVNGSTTWDAASIERVKELLELSAEPFSECELALLQPLDRLFQAAITKSE
jgi:hexosaminidase